MMKRTSWWAAVALVGLLGTGCAAHREMAVQHVAVAVTDEGFVPSEVTVHKGQPVALEVTRKTGKTFAKELEMTASGIRRDLPVNEPVVINFTPKEAGQVEYSVGNELYRGRIVIE
jgi:plastocyanin domain-containing protein